MRAAYYQWVVFAVAAELLALSKIVLHTRLLPQPERMPVVASAGFAEWQDVARALSLAIEGKPYLLGEAFSLADVMVGGSLLLANFETLERLIAQGDAHTHTYAHSRTPQPGEFAANAEHALMAQEVRLACTQGVLLSLERDQRIAWILAEIFELSSDEAATVLELEIATYRKRLSRARARLETWMRGHCGLANGANRCRCARQIPIATAFGVLDIEHLEYARHSGPALRVVAEADELEAAASILKAHPSEPAPPAILESIRALIDSGRYRVFDA